jgi:hypothetical protein
MSASGPRRVAWLLAVVGLASCIPEGPPLNGRRQTDDDAGSLPPISIEPRASDAAVELGSLDPHALVGVDPARGPWSGGQARIVRGNGFAPGLRVWFGPNEVPKGDIIPIDPSRAQVVVPAGTPGATDVKAQIKDDASTARVLIDGYIYEDFYADPSTGPTSGGTIVHLYGQGTAWAAGTTVTIENAPCEPVEVISATELTCTTPKGTAGAKSITVTADKVSVVREGFTYADTNNGFRGGLAGNKLATTLKVLVLDDYTGAPIPGAYVLAGDDVATGLSKVTGSSGVVVFNDPMLGPKRSVTIAAKCFQPTTFVDVPVDSVTAYLLPVLSPACASGGDPPSVGGRGIALSSLFGELVWGVDGEFRSAAWGNLPSPVGSSEKLAAYVFTLTGDPRGQFYLPDAALAIRPDSPMGKVGFPFLMQTILGNLTLYALAGIEDRNASPPKFTAYVMGIVRGVSAAPGMSTSNIYIPMNIRLDHAVTLVAKTPDPGPRGPDRASFTVSLELQRGGYAILPVSTESWVMPVDRWLSFVGMPALAGPLAGARYIASGLAGTGPLLTSPLSEVGFFASTSETIALDTFVPVPTLSYPAYGGAWDALRLSYAFAPSGRPVDLTVIDITSGGGLVDWLVAAPGGTRNVTLPDLRTAFPQGALVPGNVSIQIAGASIDAFDYGQLRYRQLGPVGFNAYSLDAFPARSP